MNKFVKYLLLLVLTLGVSLSCLAAAPGCNVTGTSMAFGNYSAGQPEALDMTGYLGFYCPKDNFPVIMMDLSAGVSGNADARTMALGAQRLSYQIYTDAARTEAFTRTKPNTHNPQGNFQITIYGRIFGNQDVPSGLYSDVLTLSVLP